jgi:hypothetical protein
MEARLTELLDSGKTGKALSLLNPDKGPRPVKKVEVPRTFNDHLTMCYSENLVELAGEAEDQARKVHEAAEASTVKALEACDVWLARARRRLAEAEDDLLDEFKTLVRKLKEEKAACEADLARLRVEAPQAQEGDAEMLTRWLESCKAVCDGPTGSPEEQNAVLRELVKEVLVFPPDHPGKGNTVGQLDLLLPEWLSRVMATTGDSRSFFSPPPEMAY